MKTRIFTTAAMFLLTTGLVEGAFQQNTKDSTTVLAYVPAQKNQSAPVSGFKGQSIMENNTFTLENWIAGREVWEQEGAGYETESNSMGTVNLLDWVSGREAWEQESDTYSNYSSETVSLEEWITGRENWEQERSDEEIPGFTKGSDILGKWIAERENWEQK